MSNPAASIAAAAAAVAVSKHREQEIAVAGFELDTSSSSSLASEQPPPRVDAPKISVEGASQSVSNSALDDQCTYINSLQPEGHPADSMDTSQLLKVGPTTSSQPPTAFPVIRLEINKRVYAITNATISIVTDGDTADVKVSLDIGSASEEKRQSSEVVKQIKTSFKSSKKVLVGAANKLLKQGRAALAPSGGGACETSSRLKSTCSNGAGESASPLDTDRLDSGTAGSADLVSVEAATEPVPAAVGLSISAESAVVRRTNSSSQENTIESETATPGQSSNEASSKPSKSRTLKSFLNNLSAPKSSQPDQPGSGVKGQTEPPASPTAFPDCMPDKLKLLFQVTPEMRLVTSVYAADCTAVADELKQIKKSLIPDHAKRKMKLNGKSRSVWLDPTAGEKLEIWKLYYDRDDRCQMMLGRVPGTELYGYTLPREIDTEKRFETPAEQAAYDKAVRCLACFDDIYADEEPREEPGEVYM